MGYDREVDLVRSGMQLTVGDFDAAIADIQAKQVSNMSLPKVLRNNSQ